MPARLRRWHGRGWSHGKLIVSLLSHTCRSSTSSGSTSLILLNNYSTIFCLLFTMAIGFWLLPLARPPAIARNGRQNPHILIWLGPVRRNGRRRGSVTCTETSPIQSQWRFRSDCLLPSEIGTSWCGRILHSMAFVLFCLYLSKIKRKKRVKYRPLWQLNFFPGHHEPVDRHWPPVKSSFFTKTARQKVPFSWGRVGGIQFHSIGFAERHV